MSRLMTAKEVASEILPAGASPRTVDFMRQKGLPAMKLGRSWWYERADVERFIQAAKVTACPDRIAVPTSTTALIAGATTSTGRKTADRTDVAQLQQTANALKQRSPRSSANATAEVAQQGHVIPLISRSSRP